MSKRSKSALAKDCVLPLITRDDIASLLVVYYGAVRLDEVRAEELCSCGERKQACTDSRHDHLRHIYLLLNTLSHVSEETLAELTVLAATQRPIVVREVLSRMLAEGSSAHLVGERMWTAPEFFLALVNEVGQGDRVPKDGEDTVKRMMHWLNPVDPLRTAQDCGYKKRIPKIWR